MLLRGRKANTVREEQTGVCVIFYCVVFILLLFFKLQMFVIRTLLYEYSQNGTNFFLKKPTRDQDCPKLLGNHFPRIS